jgi:hypothetical protein
MKSAARIIAIAILCLPLKAFSGPGQQDVIELKDGRTVKGEIVDESANDVTLMFNGARRVYSRNFIAKIDYAAEGSAPQASQAQDNGDGESDSGSLDSELAARYRVPQKEVVWVRRQGITDDDLPVVFDIAAQAQVLPSAVVKLRLQKMSWNEIRAHFGLPQTGIDTGQDPPPAHVHVEVSGPVPVILPPPNILFRILFWPFLLFRHLHR